MSFYIYSQFFFAFYHPAILTMHDKQINKD